MPNPEQRLVSTWESITKDNEGEAHIHTLHKYETLPEAVEEGQFVNQAAPTKITPSRRVKPTRGDSVTVFFPDAQIPFHDEEAVAAAHTAVRELQPDNVVMLGDMLDFPGLSRFEDGAEHAGKVQESLDTYHQMLAQVRADVPDSRIFALTGNHEARLQKSIIKNNAELLGIKRANAEQELGVLTLDFLLRTDELEVEMIGGYPNGTLWLEDHLRATHGTKSNARGSTSAAYLNAEPYVSTVHGHSHRAEMQWKTTPTRDGHIQRFGMSPGTLARIDGAVPSFYSTTDEHGQMVPRAENWQQAVGVVEHNPTHANAELAMITNGVLRLRGQNFEQ